MQLLKEEVQSLIEFFHIRDIYETMDMWIDNIDADPESVPIDKEDLMNVRVFIRKLKKAEF